MAQLAVTTTPRDDDPFSSVSYFHPPPLRVSVSWPLEVLSHSERVELEKVVGKHWQWRYNQQRCTVHRPGARPMSSLDPITVWITKLKEGEEAVVRELLERYFQRLVHLARARLRGRPALAA